MSTDGQGTKWHKHFAENFNRLRRAHERYRQQTIDRRQTDGRQHIANVNVVNRSRCRLGEGLGWAQETMYGIHITHGRGNFEGDGDPL